MSEERDAAAAERTAVLRTALGDGAQGVPDELLRQAVTHRSWAYEHGGVPTNERLEFLGDSVLGLVVTTALFEGHPDLPEGQLAKLRAGVVSARALGEVARTLGLGEHLLLGRGEEATGGRAKTSILADTTEALIAAVYLACGQEVATRFVRRLFDPVIAEAARRGAGLDWKTSLQELAAARGEGPPDYVVTESGPDHAKHFRAEVRLGRGLVLGAGEGASKKEAELRAAATAWERLEAGGPPEPPGPPADPLVPPGPPGPPADPLVP